MKQQGNVTTSISSQHQLVTVLECLDDSSENQKMYIQKAIVDSTPGEAQNHPSKQTENQAYHLSF